MLPRACRALATFTLIGSLALAGCATAFSAPEDFRIVVHPDRFYVVARDSAVARAICIKLGLDPSQVEHPRFADGGKFALVDSRLGTGVRGCYMQARHVIVCAEGDKACILHEERHAREGNFHE